MSDFDEDVFRRQVRIMTEEQNAVQREAAEIERVTNPRPQYLAARITFRARLTYYVPLICHVIENAALIAIAIALWRR